MVRMSTISIIVVILSAGNRRWLAAGVPVHRDRSRVRRGRAKAHGLGDADVPEDRRMLFRIGINLPVHDVFVVAIPRSG
jgi:hypothetical protein